MSHAEIRSRYEYRFKREIDFASITGQARSIDLVERVDQPGSLYVRKTYRFPAGKTKVVAKAQEYLLSEYRILSSLRHPHIVPLVDCEYLPQVEKWDAFLFMEFCEYGDLSQYMTDHHNEHSPSIALSLTQFWDISFQLVTALLYCHTGIVLDKDSVSVDDTWKEPILHRDIKPQNVLISDIKDDRIKVKLCDFGFAKHEKSVLSMSNVGTQGYLPPEITSGSRKWSPKSDVYCFGATMRRIFDEMESSDEIEAFISICIERDASARPTTVQLADMILEYFSPGNKHDGDPFGACNTVARIAARRECLNVLRALHNLQEDILDEDEKGQSLVHVAARNGWIKVVEWLHEMGYDLGKLTKSSGTHALLFAAEGGQVMIIDYLRNLGHAADVATPAGANAMHSAAFYGHTSLVDYLQGLGISIGSRMCDGSTPMHFAALGGFVELMQHLRNSGQDIGVKTNNGQTPMHYAARSGQINTVEYLRNLGQSADAETEDGDIPMHYAAWHGRFAMVDYFRNLGQSIDKANHSGWTPIEFATYGGQTAMVDYLQQLLLDGESKDRFIEL